MRQHVSMFCEYSGGPGMYWSQHLSFIGNDKSYRVWSQSDEDTKRVLAKHACQPLTWRQMISDIRELDDIGLGGDLLAYIDVTGIGDFEGALLKLAWCKFDGPGDTQLTFLLQLQDNTLALLAPKLGDLCEPEVLEAVGEVIDAAEKYFVPASIIEQGIVELAPILDQGLDAWVKVMLDWIDQHQPPGPTEAEVATLHTAEQLETLIQGPSPGSPKVAAILLERWLDVDPKPVAYGQISGIGTTSTAFFLRWLVARVGESGFQALVETDRDLAQRFIEGFLAHANYEIHRYKTSGGGGAIGAGMRSALAGSWRRLIKRVLGQAAPIPGD